MLSCYTNDPKQISEVLAESTDSEDLRAGVIALASIVDKLMVKIEKLNGGSK